MATDVYSSEFQRAGEDEAEEQATLPSTMRNHLYGTGSMFTDTKTDSLQSCWWQGRNSQAREGKLIQLDGGRKQPDWYSALPEHLPEGHTQSISISVSKKGTQQQTQKPLKQGCPVSAAS